MIKSKFNSKKVKVNGITFDSKKEAKRYTYLIEKQQNGEIHDLNVHVKFELIPKLDKERACNYYADFTYLNKNNELIVEDVKGSKRTITDVYKIKRKLMLYKYGIKVKEIL